MRGWPAARSWVEAAEDAVKRLRHAPVDMRYFAADDRPPADLCVSLVTDCDLYVGIIGTRYGSPVRDDPARSYTELEFDTASELRKRRLVFLIDETAATAAVAAGDAGAAAASPANDPWAARQATFRQRVLDSGLTANFVATPEALETGIVHAVAQLMLADAQRAAPAAASAPAVPAPARVPRQLPPEAAAFVDRVHHFQRLSALLAAPDERRAFIGVVSGPAGVGKTSFAVHVAHGVRGRFPDGQLYVDLRGYSPQPPLPPEEALDGFVRALGADPAQVPADVGGLGELYRSLLDGRHVLVILDNALSAEQVRPLLPPPGSAVIVTSRGPLSGLVVQDGAMRLALEPLEPLHAEALLRALTTAGLGPGEPEPAAKDDVDPVARLARQCGYLPLALRIAAEQAALSGLSLAELVDELASEHGRLDALTGVDDDPNSEVRTVFSWSYRNLSEPLRRAFRLLALHPGGELPTAAAAAVLGVPIGAAGRALDSLVAFNVLERPGRGRYRFHDLVREYAAERLIADEPADERGNALDRELDWYLHAADAADRILAPLRRHVEPGDALEGVPTVAFAGHDAALAWCDAERHNLAAMTELAAATGRPMAAWKLALAPVTFFKLRHHHADWLAASEVAVAATRAAGDPSAEAWALTNVGGACLQLGHLDRAWDVYQESLTGARRTGDRVGEAMTLANLGELAQALARFDQALDYGGQARNLWRALGDRRRDEAFALQDAIAPAYRARGQFDQALRAYGEAYELCRGTDLQGEGLILRDLGRTRQLMGDPAGASADYEHALTVHRTSGDRVGEATTLRALATARAALDDQVGAQSALLQALAILIEQDRAEAADEVRAALRAMGLDPGTA
ncbi:hypothetical protein BCD48_40115 [Pseudofrankia sp. BMG5.36]|nr:hypothetical protein BCD48_40115 [Pseudofrankia sp. BMG5.36]